MIPEKFIIVVQRNGTLIYAPSFPCVLGWGWNFYNALCSWNTRIYLRMVRRMRMMHQKVSERNGLGLREELSKSLAGEAEENLQMYRSQYNRCPSGIRKGEVRTFTAMPTRSVGTCARI